MTRKNSVSAPTPGGAIHGAMVLLAFMTLAGCAWLPIRHTGNPVAPIDSPSDTLTAAHAPRDTVAPGPPPPIGTEPVTEEPPAEQTHAEPATHKTAEPETTTAPPAAAATAPDSTGQEPLSVSEALSEAEKQQLRTACLGDLTAAEAILSTASVRTDAQAPDKEKLETIRGFITESRSALDKEDIRAAANLAHKARVLAEALATP